MTTVLHRRSLSYGSPAHRDLHSFPTRRSSDLIGKARFFFTPGVPRELRRMLEEQIIPRLLARGGAPSAIRLKRFQDRKSTRLNSSHPSISYAVFCLKKKKHTSNQYRS